MRKWIKRLGFFLLILLALLGLGRLLGGGSKPFGKALGILEVNGTIWVSDDWVKQIEKFRKDHRILGVVVRINSPGGTVAASQEIYTSLKRLAQTKPVVASMGSVAASGGLYLALGAKNIYADPGTITGSIGVRMQHLNLADLLRFTKIEYETIKSGKLKDLASISRPLSTEERTYLEGMMAEIHQQFKEAVASSRGLGEDVVEQLSDGRIFTGAKAKEFGLIDEIGDFTQAVLDTAKMAGIKGEPELIYGEEPTLWWFKALFGMVKAWSSGPVFCYLYP